MSTPTRALSGPRRAFAAAVLLAAGALLAGAAAPRVADFKDLRWRNVGPFRGGRTRAACGAPQRPGVFYSGAVNGGVWKTDDYGRTWRPIFDDQPTQSIGAIAVAESDPDIVYVASGEGLQRPDLSVGDGIYRSADGGRTWTHLGLRDGQQIPALAVDRRDPDRLFAAVLGHPYGPNEERGLFRSTDGGKTWKKVLGSDPDTGASDVKIDPADPRVIYAALWRARQGPWEDFNEYGGAGGGLYKSTDGGDTWRKLTRGLPGDLVQIYVAVAPSRPSRLYATVATTTGLGIYRSDDAGESWVRATEDSRPSRRIGGGDLPVPAVDPENPDLVYTTSTVAWRSRDGGKTWTGFRGAPGGDDYQNIWIDPKNPRVILLVADQGALVTVNGGETWSSWYNQPTAQLYHAVADEGFPYRVCAGQQESGSVCIFSRGNDGRITFREWHPVGVIEYGYVAPDPLHPDLVYGAGRDEVSRYDWRTGQVQNVTPLPLRSAGYRTDRTEPLVFSPVDPRVLYYAANVVFSTADGGDSWRILSPDLTRKSPGIPKSLGALADKDPYARKVRGAVYALAPSYKTVETLWAGTDDGQIWVTRNGGKEWKNVTPPELTPWSKVTQLVASRHDDVTAYASVSRFRIDDLRPYIYRTHDGGKSWKLVARGLPADAPVDTVREDPVRKGMLYAGTEKAVWVSLDDGDSWEPLQLNLPHTSMRDLWIHGDDLIVATHGRGFWILDGLTPLRQIGEASDSGPRLFRPGDAVRIRRDLNTDTPLPPDEPAGTNPPDGAILDYFLPAAASGGATLEILDARGKRVRRYASTDPPGPTEEELRKTASVPLYWIRRTRTLPDGAGAHRWIWDLRYPPPRSEHYGYPISAVPGDTPRVPLGPAVLPGRYTVRLEAGGTIRTAPLVVTMDPRVKTPPEGLEAMFRMESRLVTLMNACYDAVVVARPLAEELEKPGRKGTGDLAGQMDSLRDKLSKVLGKAPGYLEPPAPEPSLRQLAGDLGSLYAQVGGADAAPTRAQAAALETLEGQFAAVSRKWEEIRNTDVPALNRRLKEAGRPVLRLEPKPEKFTESEDLE